MAIVPTHQAIEEAITPGEKRVSEGQQKLEVFVVEPAVLALLAGEAADLVEQVGVLDAISVTEDRADEERFAEGKRRRERIEEMGREGTVVVPVAGNACPTRVIGRPNQGELRPANRNCVSHLNGP